MSPAEILRAAKAKIADPAHWCQHSYAQTTQGRAIGAEEANACRWCALGALRAVNGFATPAIDLLSIAAAELGRDHVADLNDNTDHATVMALYDRAIALAEEEPTP